MLESVIAISFTHLQTDQEEMVTDCGLGDSLGLGMCLGIYQLAMSDWILKLLPLSLIVNRCHLPVVEPLNLNTILDRDPPWR